MKHYQQVLLILETSGKPKAKADKLTKIKLESEDRELNELLANVIKMYNMDIKPDSLVSWRNFDDEQNKLKYPTSYQEWISALSHFKQKLKFYALEMVKQGKPMWQVLAEKNGWTPSKKA